MLSACVFLPDSVRVANEDLGNVVFLTKTIAFVVALCLRSLIRRSLRSTPFLLARWMLRRFFNLGLQRCNRFDVLAIAFQQYIDGMFPLSCVINGQ